MTTPLHGTCSVCGQQVPWEVSTLGGHPMPEGGTPRVDRKGKPIKRDGVAQCAGSYKPPTEAKPRKPMTKDERRLAREMFGDFG